MVFSLYGFLFYQIAFSAFAVVFVDCLHFRSLYQERKYFSSFLQWNVIEGRAIQSPQRKWKGTICCSCEPSGLEVKMSTERSNMKPSTPVCEYRTVLIPTSYGGPPKQAVSTEDLTPIIRSMLTECGIKNGFVTVISRHTTTAITINERESRLAKDMEEYFLRKLAPPDERSESEYATSGVRYRHNDINLRPESIEEKQRCLENGWDIDDADALQNWRQQEPINAHSHLISMLLGSSECIPIQDSKLVLGQWQSVLLVDLDGPRDRTVGIQFMGFC